LPFNVARHSGIAFSTIPVSSFGETALKMTITTTGRPYGGHSAMSGSAYRVLAAASAVVAVTVSGCTIESPLAVRRCWADYNTLRADAVIYETTSRVPLDSARVRELRWMYNAGPHEPGRMILLPVVKKPVAGTNSASASASTTVSPLPPPPVKLDAPDSTAPPAGPVAAQPPDAERTAQSHDAWRFIH
jgi:hypothetical protein